MGDISTVAVHRCRFIDFAPSAITAITFPPLPLPSVKSPEFRSQPLKFGTLAIGRANGNIELCEWTGARQAQAPQAWVVQKTLSGRFPSKIDSLAFTLRYPENLGPERVPSCSDLRLFSSGGGNELIEWDLSKGCVRRSIGSQGGSIWSIAANPASNLLALGCEDGSIRLLSLIHDTLVHHRRFDRVKCRLLSIAWGPPVPRQTEPKSVAADDSSSSDDDDDDWNDSWLVTGGSDSSLRKWDMMTGRVVDRMGTDKMRGERTLVWAVGVLGNGTIVSGDSLGMVKFWDSRTCTQLQSFQGHGADVLCLTISPGGSTVYTSGVDQKITQFTHIKTSTPDSSSTHHSSSRWVQSCSRRMHSHDVRAIAIWPPHTPLPSSHRHKFPIDVAPILASGGLDMSVVLTPAASAASTAITKIVNPLSTSIVSTFEDSYHRRLAYTSGPSCTSALRIARQARLACCARDTGLSIWRIFHRQESLSDDNTLREPAQSVAWEKVLDIELKAHTNIIASAISDDGQWLVVSDLYETKLFALDSEATGDLKPRRIRDFALILQAHLPNKSTSTGGSVFHFTPDSQRLAMATAMSSYILLVDLGTNSEQPRVLRRFDHHRAQNLVGGSRIIKKSKSDRTVSDVNEERNRRKKAFEAGHGDGSQEGAIIGDSNSGNEAGPVVTTVSRMAISADGQWLATTDDLARTYIFNLDSMQHHCVLPSFHQRVQSLTFKSSSTNILIITFPSNSFQIFDVESCVFPEWSKKLVNSLPKRFANIHDPIMGVTFDPAATAVDPVSQRALLWGSSWICRVTMNEQTSSVSKKRLRESALGGVDSAQKSDLSLEEQPSNNFKMVTHYRPILLVDFLGPGELVVVERPLVDVLATLPPAYFKPKYGAS